jgi:hypothetical protein
MTKSTTKHWAGAYSRWRHGGWYVHNVRYPSGAVGCVSNNYHDKKWRIACNSDEFEDQPTFSTREDAANAERIFVQREQLSETLTVAIEALKVALIALGDEPHSDYPHCTSEDCAACKIEAAIKLAEPGYFAKPECTTCQEHGSGACYSLGADAEHVCSNN